MNQIQSKTIINQVYFVWKRDIRPTQKSELCTRMSPEQIICVTRRNPEHIMEIMCNYQTKFDSSFTPLFIYACV